MRKINEKPGKSIKSKSTNQRIQIIDNYIIQIIEIIKGNQ